MFLPDEQVDLMTGIDREKHKPVRLKNWLDDYGYVLGETYFKRVDGWYSVMAPQARTTFVPARPQVRRRA
jgi:hypothetical protein